MAFSLWVLFLGRALVSVVSFWVLLLGLGSVVSFGFCFAFGVESVVSFYCVAYGKSGAKK